MHVKKLTSASKELKEDVMNDIISLATTSNATTVASAVALIVVSTLFGWQVYRIGQWMLEKAKQLIAWCFWVLTRALAGALAITVIATIVWFLMN